MVRGGPAVRFPPNKKGYEIQANTLDAMWKGTAALAGTTTGQDALKGMATTLAQAGGSALKPDVAVPIAGTLLFTAVQGLINPNALAIGGGFEIVLQSDYVVSHTNVVLGLVETIVGLIPAGGGCKEMLWRWMQAEEAKNDPNFAPLKVCDLIGYA